MMCWALDDSPIHQVTDLLSLSLLWYTDGPVGRSMNRVWRGGTYDDDSQFAVKFYF